MAGTKLMKTTNSASRPSVMVVDDEVPITEVIERALQYHDDWTVRSFNDPLDALEAIKSDPPHVLVTDINMPNMDGLELTSEAMKLIRDLPVIIMTGNGDVSMAVRAMRLGARDFLQKPISLMKLRQSIEAEVDYAMEKREEPSSLDFPSGDELLKGKPTLIGGYELLKLLGEGAIGAVYLCRKDSGNERYALKLLKVLDTSDGHKENFFQRFINEGNAISQLNHPNVVKFFEIGHWNEDIHKRPYIVMEYFEGEPLTQFLENPETLDLKGKISIIKQVASGLDAVHKKKIFHRDVKPDNILVDKKLHLKITDFGVCHLPTSDLTHTRHLIGTPSYISPEHFQRKKVSRLVDIYSLGVLAYELFLGVKPFDSDNFHGLVQKIVNEYPVSPREMNSEFPFELQRILGKMLKKNPKNRYQHASEIIDDLERFERLGSSEGLFDKIKSLSLFGGRNWQ